MFKRVLRLSLLALVGAVGLIANSPAAVAAPGAGAGAVTGTVTITTTPGLDINCRAVSFTFSGFVLVGAVTVGQHTYAGPVSTGPVSGQSADLNPVAGAAPDPRCAPGQDSALAGEGTINAFTVTGSVTVTGVGHTISGSCTGQYRRIGTNVVVTLNCTLTVSRVGPGSLSSTTTGTIVVAAEFVPLDGDGVTDPVTNASFAGAFAGAGQ